MTIRFVHLSDLHVEHPARGNLVPGVDGAARLRATLAEIATLSPAPAFILAAGDLTNHGDAESYAHLRDILATAGVPVVHTLGNHDRRPAYRREMLGDHGGSDAPCDQDVVVGGVHVIALDSLQPGELGGGFEPAQFAFLEAALARHPALPKLLVFHHPPSIDLDPAMEWESLRVEDTQRLAAAIAGHHVVGICVGHLHKARASSWHGVPVVHAVSQWCQHDPLNPGDGLRMVEGSAFALCDLRPSGLTVTYAQAPSTRRELMVLTLADIRAYEIKNRAAHAA